MWLYYVDVVYYLVIIFRGQLSHAHSSSHMEVGWLSLKRDYFIFTPVLCTIICIRFRGAVVAHRGESHPSYLRH